VQRLFHRGQFLLQLREPPVLDLRRLIEIARRCAFSISSFACSSCSRTMPTALMAAFSFCHWALRLADSSFKLPNPPRVFEPLARTLVLLFPQRVRSISSCMICRSNWSISVGIESSSIRKRDAASSTRSTALSGRNGR
jgi:hypothetical protein